MFLIQEITVKYGKAMEVNGSSTVSIPVGTGSHL